MADLVYIKTRNTGTGKVEIHVASATSNYQTRILETGTTITLENNGTCHMADFVQSDKQAVQGLAYIKNENTDAGKVEVHMASGVLAYQTRVQEVPTTFATENNGIWQMVNYTHGVGIPNLSYIKTSITSTNTVEVQPA